MPFDVTPITVGDVIVQTCFQPTLSRTLINLSSTGVEGLGSHGNLAHIMHAHGWSVASPDLPGHGQNRLPFEGYNDIGDGLVNWQKRVAQDMDPVQCFIEQLNALIARLIADGHAEVGRIAISGTSRGGFLALHAAEIPEVAAVVALVPVTALPALNEFMGTPDHWITRRTAVGVALKTTKPIYVEVGHADIRVGAAPTLRNIADVVERLPTTHKITLRMEEAFGHAIPQMAESRAYEWLCAKVH